MKKDLTLTIVLKKTLCLVLTALTLIALPCCYADVAMTPAPAPEAQTGDMVINEIDSVYYNDGATVFNNCGIVFNNSGTVYNNGGTVFLNGGLCYNNTGTVYVNGGTVINNNGQVIENIPVEEKSETIEEPENEEIPEEEVPEGYFEISLSEGCESFAELEGFTEINGKHYLSPDGEVTIAVKPGFSLLNSSVTTGRCTVEEDGTLKYVGAERDGSLMLKFSVDVPVLVPKFGAYGETQELEFICGDGAGVYYQINGSGNVKENGRAYTEPFAIEKSCSLEYYASAPGAEDSRIISGRYVFPELKAPTFEELYEGFGGIEPKPISVKNTGLDRLKILSVRLAGRDKDCLVLSTEEGGSVNPGMTDEKTWCIAPVDGLRSGSYRAQAEFVYDSGSVGTAEIEFEVK